MVLIILSALNYLASHCPQHTLTLEHERLKSIEENINKIVHPLTPSESCEEIEDAQVNVIRSLFSFHIVGNKKKVWCSVLPIDVAH